MPLLLILILLFIPACTTIPATPPLPETSTPQPVARGVTGDALLSPDGRSLLYQSGTRLLLARESGEPEVVLDSLPPDSILHLSWAPDGRRFVVTMNQGGKGVVELRTVGDGTVARWERSEILGRGGWISPEEFLVPALKMTTYRFGVDIRQIMLRYRSDSSPPAEVVLHSATIRPTVFSRYREALERGFVITPHPLGDTILFTRFHDPPEFTPYRKIILMHLESGEQTEVGSTPLDSPAPIFTGTDDVILSSDSGSTLSVDPWTMTKSTILPKRGDMTCARHGTACLIAGELMIGREHLTSFPGEARGNFSDDGTRLVVTYRGDAFSLRLPPATAPAGSGPDARRDRLIQLRTLRAKRLISPQEFSSMIPTASP